MREAGQSLRKSLRKGLVALGLQVGCCCCHSCAKLSSKQLQKKVPASSVSALGPHGVPYGHVCRTSQTKWVERIFRNRFWSRHLPLFDILDSSGAIRYTVIQPVTPGKFLFCIPCKVDQDYLLIVPGDRKQAAMAIPKDGSPGVGMGWVVPLKNGGGILDSLAHNGSKGENCICGKLTDGMSKVCAMFCRAFESLLNVFRVCCVIDDKTHIANPGKHGLARTTRCTHTLAAMRTYFPPGAHPGDRELILSLTALLGIEEHHF